MNPAKNEPSDDLDCYDENEAVTTNFQGFFGTAREVLARYAHCEQCDSNLHFNYFTDFSRNLTQEVSRCPECGTRAKKLTHRLQ